MSIVHKLSQPEGRKLEFKRRLPSKSDVLKTIIAFANGAGGELIFGVSDSNREVVGVDDPLLLEEQISNMIHDGVQPFISPYISTVNLEGKTILMVRILAGYNKPYFRQSQGPEEGVYIRVGSTNRRADAELITELRRQGRGLAYELEPDLSKSADALEPTALDWFFKSIDQPRYTEETLVKWKLLRQNNGDWFPTVAGLVLFGRDDLLDYDFAGIRLTRYQGVTLSNISETKEFSVPVSTQIDAVCRSIAAFLQKESYLQGAQRLERTRIPSFAVREVVVNAVVHRDYSIVGSSIKVNIFDDRLEVVSPGVLYGNVDLSDLGTGISECRNRAMVRVFRRLNLMEELGTGVARIFELYREKGLKSPEFSEQGQFFKAVLPQESESGEMRDRILALIARNGELNASKLSQQLGVHRNTVLKYLNQMMADQTVRKTGTGRTTRYRLR